MDILLSHGYFIAEDEHEQKIMKPYPTLGLLYISSHLKAAGFSVDLWDSTFRTMAEFAAHVQQSRPPLVGLYCNLMTKFAVLKMIPLCKQAGATVILGGPEPASYIPEYLEAGADIIVIGEGETTLAELIPHLARRGLSGLHTISGIAFRNEEGEPVHTPARALLPDLSAQPWPDRAAIPMHRYLSTWKEHHGLSSVSLITARGCPYTCTWCSHSVFGHTHRRRRPEEVADEVAWIREEYNPDQLWYADDVLTIAPRWFLTYAAELKARGIRIPFECISRADRLDEKAVDALAEMGCSRLWIGSESGSQRVLDAMKRKANVLDVQQKTKMLQARGIEVGMFIMLGYDGEELEDLEATVEHLRTASPDVFLTTVAYPIKGTRYYEAARDRVITHAPWAERTDRDLGVAGRHSRRFYDHATRWMVSEVGLHRAIKGGERNPLRLARLYVNARRGWWGMRRTRSEREEDQGEQAGRGWQPEGRAAEGW